MYTYMHIGKFKSTMCKVIYICMYIYLRVCVCAFLSACVCARARSYCIIVCLWGSGHADQILRNSPLKCKEASSHPRNTSIPLISATLNSLCFLNVEELPSIEGLSHPGHANLNGAQNTTKVHPIENAAMRVLICWNPFGVVTSKSENARTSLWRKPKHAKVSPQSAMRNSRGLKRTRLIPTSPKEKVHR